MRLWKVWLSPPRNSPQAYSNPLGVLINMGLLVLVRSKLTGIRLNVKHVVISDDSNFDDFEDSEEGLDPRSRGGA